MPYDGSPSDGQEPPNWLAMSLADQTKTDAEGRYSLGPLQPGRFELRHLPAGSCTLLVHSAENWKRLTAKLSLEVQADIGGLILEQ